MSTRPIVLGAAAAVVLGAATALALSNVPLRGGHAELGKSEGARAGMSELRVRAPYGTYVIQYDVVATGTGLTLGGRGVTEAPLFGTTSTFTSYLPAGGFDEAVPLETPMRVSATSSPAAATRMPTAAEAPRTGTWLLITRDRRRFDQLASIAGVPAW